MANHGPPGGPQPWYEPRPGEDYRPEQSPPAAQPPYGPGQGYDPGQSYQPGQGYGPGQSYGPGQGHGWAPQQSGGVTYGSGQPGYANEGGQQEGGRSGPEYVAAYAGQPTPPRRRRGRGAVLAVSVAVLALVLGGATAFYLLGGDDGTPTTVSAPTPEPEPQTDLPAADEELAPTAPAASSTTDPRFVEPGQCVRNDASSGGKPKLVISDCTSKSYEVLRRFDGKTSGAKDAEAKCGQVDGYTNWYFYDSELDSLDFVLCLRQRD